MVKGNGHLKREEVPKYLQSNPRFKKEIEDGEKRIEEEMRRLNESYNTLMITKKEEEEQKPNNSYKTSTTSKIQTFSENGASIDDKVINSNTDAKSKLNTDYNNLENKKHEDASKITNDYNKKISKGILNDDLSDALRDLHHTPLASEKDIKEWGEDAMARKSMPNRIRMYKELRVDIIKEAIDKGWDTEKYATELNRMHDRIFLDVE